MQIRSRLPSAARLFTFAALLASAHSAIAQDPTAHDVEMADALLQNGGAIQGRGGGGQVTLSPSGGSLGWIGQPLDGRGPTGIWLMAMDTSKTVRVTRDGQERDMS